MDIIDLRTPENIKLLHKMPKSRLRYFVKTVTSYPTGDRNDRGRYDKPHYKVMSRPIGPNGGKSEFYGTKAHQEGLDYLDRDTADRIAFNRNFYYHESFIRRMA